MDKEKVRPFVVIDRETGKEADLEAIARNEDWAHTLMYCDMEGFFIRQDGQLILADQCGNFAYCDRERFQVIFEEEG